MHEGNSRLFHQKSWSCFCQRHSTQEGRSSEEERRNEHELKMAESLNGSVFTRSGGGSECSTLLFAEFGKVVTIDIFANTARGSTVSGWTDTTNFPSNNPVPFRFAGIIFKLVDEVEIESGSCGRVAEGWVMILNCVTSFPGVAVTDAGSILPNWDILGVISNTCKGPCSVQFRVHEQSLRTQMEEDLPLSERILVHDQGNFLSLPVREQPHPSELKRIVTSLRFQLSTLMIVVVFHSVRKESPPLVVRYLSVNYIVTRDERDLIDWLLLVHQMVELC
ncbi:hypothetical protein BLNAU_6624 [Blattamonas nauphoetae]|uniref:Uncharacterized protein n=1 Tax=Blattamonas nauphoetae TaxID=2049346 RepID=A0ABQ9Y3S4_9EUKA|nr:hypothetical protein BLNAU_6624 [Blattamonas nauphoetae]